jgi:hypothetical protein
LRSSTVRRIEHGGAYLSFLLAMIITLSATCAKRIVRKRYPSGNEKITHFLIIAI